MHNHLSNFCNILCAISGHYFNHKVNSRRLMLRFPGLVWSWSYSSNSGLLNCSVHSYCSFLLDNVWIVYNWDDYTEREKVISVGVVLLILESDQTQHNSHQVKSMGNYTVHCILDYVFSCWCRTQCILMLSLFR